MVIVNESGGSDPGELPSCYTDRHRWRLELPAEVLHASARCQLLPSCHCVQLMLHRLGAMPFALPFALPVQCVHAAEAQHSQASLNTWASLLRAEGTAMHAFTWLQVGD